MKKVAFALGALLLISGARAGPVVFTEAAGTKCEVFLQYPSGSGTWNVFGTWAGGFLSGLNWFSSQRGLADGFFTDIEAAMGWITDYCRRNPEHPFGAAVSHYAASVILSRQTAVRSPYRAAAYTLSQP